MAKKTEQPEEKVDRSVTLVLTQRENGELQLLFRTKDRDEALGYAEAHGAILVSAEQYLPPGLG